MDKSFIPGEQIAYIPTHANGDIEHPDVEFGFVTAVAGNTVFCRYWRKDRPGELRTTANSEGTPRDALVRHQAVAPSVVERHIASIAATNAFNRRYRRGGIE